MRLPSCSASAILILSLATMHTQAATRDILVFEASTRTLQGVSAQVEGRAAYLPVVFFESALHLERKDLAPDLVGLCQDDLCIPLPVRVLEGEEHVSALGLIEALKGAYVWDEDASQLFLDLRSRLKGTPSQGPIDFSLPDLEGHAVRLFDFRGRKVAVFAWASW